MTTKGAEKSRWSSKSFHIYKPGQIVVGRYRVMRVIAAGGQAEVYEVVDSECMEYRALKTPDMRNCESPAMVERMVREFKAFSNVQHRGLVRMYDAGVDQDDQFYIVMELIDGPTLRDLINRHRRFPTGVALSLMNQIARAVHVLHATGCIHRDLKPENILVRELPDEAAHRAVVIDLGIARFIGQSTTSNGVSMGTVTYMAPEQTQDKRVDARADVYAICLMLYEMLAGKHALSGDCAPGTRDEWAARQRDFEPKPLDELGLGVHPLLSNLVKRGLSKKAAQRFDSAADLANHIEAIKDALQHIGQLGPERFEDFLPTEREVNESGPQPIARVRPAGVETPSQGLPYRRTAEVEVAPVEPVRVSPEPPRVVVHPDKLAARGTQRMLGRMGTVPNLDAMRAGRAAQPQPVPPAPPPPAPVETAKAPPAADKPASDKRQWKSVAREPVRVDPELAALLEGESDGADDAQHAPAKPARRAIAARDVARALGAGAFFASILVGSGAIYLALTRQPTDVPAPVANVRPTPVESAPEVKPPPDAIATATASIAPDHSASSIVPARAAARPRTAQPKALASAQPTASAGGEPLGGTAAWYQAWATASAPAPSSTGTTPYFPSRATAAPAPSGSGLWLPFPTHDKSAPPVPPSSAPKFDPNVF